MATLWATNFQRGVPTYVNLFENVHNLQDEFIDWDLQILETNWWHNFLGIQIKPIKSNSTAHEFNEKGNECYERGEWRQAIELYNRGLCFAKEDSRHMQLLFLKRGFCFSELHMFNEGVKDVEIALNFNFSLDSVQDVKNCVERWKQLSQIKLQKRSHNIPTLSFDSDATLSNMANVLEVKENTELGETYIVAKTDIDIGQIVLVDEAFVAVANGFDRAYCCTCLKTGQNLLPCSQCTDVMFCDSNCMDLNEVHKRFCGAVYQRMPTDIKFVVQSILEAIVLFPDVKLLMKFVANPLAYKQKTERMFDYALFLTLLQSSVDQPLLLTYKVYTTLMAMPTVKSKFDCKTKERFLMHLISHHAQILLNDAFGDFETEQNQFIAATMFNMATLLKHSCAPNLMHFPFDNREVFITIRKIKAGDCLTYDYWNWNGNVDDSRKQWLQNQDINCDCGKCEYHLQSNQQMNVDPLFIFISNYKKHFRDHASRVLKKRCETFLQKFQYDEWTMELEFVTKAYILCLLAEYKRTI